MIASSSTAGRVVGPRGRALRAALRGLLLFGIFLFGGGCAERSTGGLDQVRQRGVLRVAVPPGFAKTSVPTPTDRDVKTEIANLATRLGVETEWVEAKRHDELLRLLSEGRADLVAFRRPPELLRETGAIPTTPVEWVDEVLVAAAAMPDLSAEDLRAGEVYVHASRLSPAVAEALGELQLQVVPADETTPLEDLLAGVVSGEIPATAIDSGVLETYRDARRLQVVRTLIERRPVVWAVRSSNNQLRRAIDDLLFAEQVLTRRTRVRACRDLPAIRTARVLRVVTRNSPTTCFVSRGGIEGFEYELAVAFARREQLRLELVIPPPGNDPLDWLERGFGDLAVLHEPVPPSLAGRFLVSEPYRWVDMLGVVSARTPGPVDFEGLAGRRVAAARPVAEMLLEFPLEPLIEVAAFDPDRDAFSAIQEVARGGVFAAVVDEDAYRLELEGPRELQPGPEVLRDVPLTWVLNPTSPELLENVNAFLRDARASGLVSQLTQKNLGTWTLHVSPRLPEVPEGDLTPYDEYLTWAARQYGIDWRLLASLMYEESRFDPDAVGPGGSAGLFQFMPFTWRELGVEDPHHPGEAIEAGARYLTTLMGKFDDLELPDRVAMAIASYNVGPRHVFDARRLAKSMNLDPDRWSGNVETAMYILDDPEVARLYPAGVCRCRRGAAYTRRILRRYHAYTEQFPPA